MSKRRKKALIPINTSTCGSCAFLEQKMVKNQKGEILQHIKCPKNKHLPHFIEPHFAEKCALYKQKQES